MPTTAKNIVQHGDPVLRSHALSVPESEVRSVKIQKVIERMKTALEACDDGVAIAAPQIGESLRIFVVSHRAFEIEANNDDEDTPITGVYEDKVFINPEIIKVSRKKHAVPEGCLSVRWLYGNVNRHEKATVRALDENGKPFTYGASGLMAQIFQHETDHLDGVLFIDTATDVEEIPPEKIAELNAKRGNT